MNLLRRLVKSLIWVFALVILVVLKCCQPLVRFQLCVVGFHRYGHLALEPEIFLAEQEIIMETGASPRRVINIWSLGPVAKQQKQITIGLQLHTAMIYLLLLVILFMVLVTG